jgi:hypothetical protein
MQQHHLLFLLSLFFLQAQLTLALALVAAVPLFFVPCTSCTAEA